MYTHTYAYIHTYARVHTYMYVHVSYTCIQTSQAKKIIKGRALAGLSNAYMYVYMPSTLSQAKRNIKDRNQLTYTYACSCHTRTYTHNQVKKNIKGRTLPKPDTVFEWGGEHVLDHRGVIHYLSTAGSTYICMNLCLCVCT